MIRLCAFADEISPDLQEQIEVLRDEGITYIELRSVWNANVLTLHNSQLDDIQTQLSAAGIAVGCIGSPIGKVSIDNAPAEVARLERAIEIANRFDAYLIRVFSFYPPPTVGTDADFRSDPGDVMPQRIFEAMIPLVERARRTGITLVHENEKGIYGDTISHCRSLLEACGGDSLAVAFDPANFIQCDQKPYPDAYDTLHSWIMHVHVKDATLDGEVTAAGEGSSCWPALLERLRTDGYEGFLSLEPHLAQTGKLGGFSGPDLFRHASQSLQTLLQRMHWPYG